MWSTAWRTSWWTGSRASHDWPLLRWALGESGFGEVHRVMETDLLARFPGFPERSDGAQTLYVKAVSALQRAGPGARAP